MAELKIIRFLAFVVQTLRRLHKLYFYSCMLKDHPMQLKIVFLMIVSLLSFTVTAQKNTSTAESTIDTLISRIASKDIPGLKQLTTHQVYCLLCFKQPNFKKDPYSISKNRFYQKHFRNIFDQDLLDRIKRNERIIIATPTESYDYLVLYTIYRPDELVKGHEGVQFGLWLKEENGILKLSGVETIP